jgi:hypothetical protein
LLLRDFRDFDAGDFDSKEGVSFGKGETGVIWAGKYSTTLSDKGAWSELGFFCCFFLEPQELPLQTALKILVARQAQQVELDEFDHAAVGPPIAVKLQEQGADEGEVNFNGHPAGRFRQPVATTQDAFDPAEEELDLPALAIKSRHEFGRHLFGRLVCH